MFSRRATFERSQSAFSAQSDQQRRTRGVLDLTVSNPTRAELDYPRTALAQALAGEQWVDYQPDCRGHLAAREAITRVWGTRGIQTSPEHTVLTASTSEAYSLLFKLFCDPGDTVLVPQPSYPLLAELARYDSIELEPYRLAYDGAWHIDFGSFSERAMARARAVVVVSPNNPTGHYTRPEEYERLRQLGLPLISDEVFFEYPHRTDVVRHSVLTGVSAPSVSEAGAVGLCVALDGLSKVAGLPQLKLGWMTFGGEPRHIVEARERLDFILDAYLSVSGPVQLALPELLELGRETRTLIQRRLSENLCTLDSRIAQAPLSRLHADGGWCACLALPSFRSEEDWVTGLLADESVLVQPGWFYDFERGPVCIVSLLTSPTVFDEGMRRLAQHVVKHSA
jgi:hypothetical protein